MASTQFNPRAGWSWDNLPDDAGQSSADSNTFETSKDEEAQYDAIPEEQQEAEEDATPPRPQRHYAPRTCRICLEDVFPTFEPAPEGIASMFRPKAKVTYVSSDATIGRLMRPCKCRGSQAYVHEGCLQSWRHADPSYGRRTFWECPTCKFQYRLERMKWSRWLTSTTLQIIITFTIMLTTIFIFGFIADPIINLYLDPLDTITSTATGGKMPAIHLDEADDGWIEHFIKGLASLGLLGFVKVFFAMSPWHWWNLRQGGLLGGGGGRRRGGGRERLENISWTVVVIGVLTFLYGVWRWVRAWTRRTLERASERVLDVPGEDDDEEEEGEAPEPTDTESRKTQ